MDLLLLKRKSYLMNLSIDNLSIIEGNPKIDASIQMIYTIHRNRKWAEISIHPWFSEIKRYLPDLWVIFVADNRLILFSFIYI
jgi:hypothetical protein